MTNTRSSWLKRFMPLVILLAFPLLLCSSCNRQPSYPPAVQIGPNVVIDAASLEPDVPQFHTYRYQNKNISYFLLKIDNRVSAFFDACASCNTNRQGYRFEDGVIICRYCNLKFPVYKLEKGLGSCYPIKIEGRMENGKYLIPVAVLEKEAGKF